MATDEQLQAYAHSLPAIYQEILAAFPRLEPNRKLGYGLAFQTIAADFEDRSLGFGLTEIIRACEELEIKNIIEVKYRVFVRPTSLGERLISLISGQQASAVQVPELPAPPV